MREAFAIQRVYEMDARSGTRYIEILKSAFGVSSPDFRLQRPEYLGGGKHPILQRIVEQTSKSETGAPQGSLSAHAYSSGRSGFTKSFTEHGIIIGLANVSSDLTYQHGIDRMFSRLTRFDYYLPALANLGEQAVLNKEIYVQGTDADDDVFGYQENFSEYRYKKSLISGKLNSSFPTSLDVWHLAEDFDSLPTLSEEFIKQNTPIDRISSVEDEPDVILDCFHGLKCT